MPSAWLSLLLVCAPQSTPPSLRTLSPTEMQDDLIRLTDEFQALHAGLHRYATPAEIDRAFEDALVAAEEEPRDVLWFFREVSALVARIRCGHTRVSLADGDRSAALAQRGLVPLEIVLRGERAWILRVLDEHAALRSGQELLAVDDLPIAEIRARALARLSDDGFIESGKERELEAEFATTFALLVAERPAGPYAVRVAGAGAQVPLAGLDPATFAARRTHAPDRPLIHLELRPADDAGVLSVLAFGAPPSGEGSFPDQLAAAFRTLREKRVAHLVLDLRGNGGGVDMYGAELVSYLTAKPFGYFERIEVTPGYAGSAGLREQDGRRFVTSHPGTDVQQPAEFCFQGKVAILIDGGTFSTAADVASVAHANGLATFVGEETGGGYEGNTSGESVRLVLPNSHLGLNVPEHTYTTANVGPGHHGRGVVPDVPLQATIEDVLAGRDVVLARALERLRAK